MADLAQLEAALVKADAAGDADGAKVLAGEVRKLRGAAEPAPVAEPTMGDRAVSIGKAAMKATPLFALPTLMNTLDKSATWAGEKVTDLATGAGASPELAAGLGTGANVALQAIPVAAGGAPAKAAAPLMRAGAEKVMQSALKPAYAELKSGAAGKAISTMLDEGINVTQGGVEKLRGQIDKINDAITAKLENNPATIEVHKVLRGRLDELRDRVMKQVTPNSDVATVDKAVNEFLNHPLLRQIGEIPVQLAQQLKQGTYRAIGGKAYGELGGADIEAQKTLARGLKDEISNAVPGVGELNGKESQLLNALEQVQKRALQEGNKNAGGMAWLAKNPAAWAAFMADKSSAFKSIVARMMNAGKEQIPAAAARVGIAGVEANANQ